MALLTHTIANLMNGVSQQPVTVRLGDQCEEQINGVCRVSDGLSKRPPLQQLSANRFTNPNAGGAEISFLDSRVKTHRVTGKTSADVVKTVELIADGNSGCLMYRIMPFGTYATIGYFSYLLGAYKEDLKFLTIADQTYLLNKNKIVTKATTSGDTDEQAMRKQGSLVWVKNGFFDTTYTAKLYVYTNAGSLAHSVTTPSFKTPTSVSATAASFDDITTTNIRTELVNDLDTGIAANATLAANIETVEADNYFQVRFKSGSTMNQTHYMQVIVNSDTAESAIIAANGVINDPTELPRKAVDAYVVRVDPDPTDGGDDYYLSYDPLIQGWTETRKLGNANKAAFTSSTLPLVISNLIEGVVAAAAMTMSARLVGDDVSCPNPSFVGRRLNDMFVFNNRLGFLSGNSVIMSKIDDFTMFYRTSSATSLTDDRVDITAATPSSRFTELFSAVPFETSLMLFGSNAQYLLQTNTGFDVTKTSLQTSTEYEASTKCEPLNLGSTVYFTSDRENYTAVFDISRKDGIGLTAEEATAHIPSYITGTAVEMVYSTTETMLFLRTEDEARTIYVHNRFIRQTVLEQNAWHKWTVPNRILGMQVVGPTLYVTMVADDNKTILRTQMDISTNRITQDPDDLELGFTPYLDLVTQMETGAVLAVDDYSDGTLFYLPEEHELNVVGVTLAGSIIRGLVDINAALEDEPLHVGLEYTFAYTFSQQVPYTETNTGKTVHQYGRLTLRNMKVSFNRTGKFDVVVTPLGREAFTTQFTSTLLGLTTTILGRLNLSTGVFKFPVNSRADSVTVTLQSSYPYPCNFNTCEWLGTFTNNAGRM